MGYAPQGGGGGGGISNLSELTIDVNKNWNLKRIENVADGINPRDLATLRQIPGIPEIEELIVFITGSVNRAIKVSTLDIDAPTISQETVAAAIGAFYATPDLTVPMPALDVIAVADSDTGGDETLPLTVPVPTIGVVAELV